MPIRNYRDLLAWQRAMQLAEDTYRATAEFPADERWALCPQVRRAAVSVPSNIAEGHGMRSDRTLRRHLAIAAGSLCELETQLLLARRLGYIDDRRLGNLLATASEVGRLINGLSNAALPRE